MTFDLQKILQSKRAFRRGLAELPIEEKLRLLDQLRERELTLREETAIGPTMPTHPATEHASKG